MAAIMPFEANRGPNSVAPREQALCGGRALTNNVGRAVFPNQTVMYDGALIDLFGTSTLTLHPTINLVFVGNGEAIRGIEQVNGHNVLDSIIYGCIIYRFADSIGKSGFAYRLLRNGNPDYATGLGLLLDSDHVARDGIVLEPMGEGDIFFAQ
jgi:hypothetical protein